MQMPSNDREKRLLADFEHVLYTQNLLGHKIFLLLSSSPAQITSDHIPQIYEFQLILNALISQRHTIQERLRIIYEPLDYLEYDMQRLKKSVQVLERKINFFIREARMNKLMGSSLSTDHERMILNNAAQRAHLSTSNLKTNGNRKGKGAVIILGSNLGPKTSRKAHLSNNIIRIVRGPIKKMIHETMMAIDVYGQEFRPIDSMKQAVRDGLIKQKHLATNKRQNCDFWECAFTRITSDWRFEEVNSDQGLSSVSIWMRNGKGQRFLVKTEDHPLSAANEWLVYMLGSVLGLPINQVQIAIYQDQLVTVHTDVANPGDQTITFMDLPKDKRKLLLHEPILACMEFLDRILQNADRNQRNILITIPQAVDIHQDPIQIKLHFVDHGACFGMHKLNAISIAASKLHYNRIGVIEFDPKDEAQKFDQYLEKFPAADRLFISDILNRFASISDEQLACWMNEIQGLLLKKQYERIFEVLRQKRDIARRYVMRWNLIATLPGAENSTIMTYL